NAPAEAELSGEIRKNTTATAAIGTTKHTATDGSSAIFRLAFFFVSFVWASLVAAGFRKSHIAIPASTAAGIAKTRFATTDNASATPASTSFRAVRCFGSSMYGSSNASDHIHSASANP